MCGAAHWTPVSLRAVCVNTNQPSCKKKKKRACNKNLMTAAAFLMYDPTLTVRFINKGKDS